MARTDLSSADLPWQIAEVPTMDGAGRIGLASAPSGQPGALERMEAWNAALVVTLVGSDELESLGIARLGEEVRRRHMEWHHWPIRDGEVPDAAFEAAWPARSAMLRSLIARGGRVLIHCRAGLGRTGMVGARLLVETGMAASEAIATVRTSRPGAIETAAQVRWVEAGQPAPLPQPARDRAAMRDRAVGALIGLAIGDAVGAAIEFSPKPRFALLTDMIGGGPHGLQRGQWTDDTAMALALADSLAQAPTLDPADLMRRFVAWYTAGSYSCTGTCFDIGNTTRASLQRFIKTGDPIAGNTDASASGNGALMRLAPVAIRHWHDPDTLLRVAELQTRTTHGSTQTVVASRVFAELLAAAIAGASLPEVVALPAARGVEGGFLRLHRDVIAGSGHVSASLRAALWAVARTTDFRSAILLAANLGEDADTTAAVAGQLAGAIHGVSGIPQDWRDALAWRERIEHAAENLFEASLSTHEK